MTDNDIVLRVVLIILAVGVGLPFATIHFIVERHSSVSNITKCLVFVLCLLCAIAGIYIWLHSDYMTQRNAMIPGLHQIDQIQIDTYARTNISTKP